MIEVRPCTVAEIFAAPNIGRLMEEYAQESAIPEVGEPNVRRDLYAQMEAAGALHAFGSWRDGELIGFLSVVVSVLPHLGRPVASTESFFVSPRNRAGAAGLRMLKVAEDKARDLGAIVLFVWAPRNGRLARLLPGKKYRETHTAFVRSLL